MLQAIVRLATGWPESFVCRSVAKLTCTIKMLSACPWLLHHAYQVVQQQISAYVMTEYLPEVHT